MRQPRPSAIGLAGWHRSTPVQKSPSSHSMSTTQPAGRASGTAASVSEAGGLVPQPAITTTTSTETVMRMCPSAGEDTPGLAASTQWENDGARGPRVRARERDRIEAATGDVIEIDGVAGQRVP